MNPYFSILIPAYNVESYIEKCLDSVKGQTFLDWETIVVDDGSTDKTGKISEQYAADDSRFIVLHQNNTGVAAARNTLLKHASGKFIIFLDGDDYWNSNYMLEEIEKAIEELDSDLIAWWCNLVNDVTGEVIPETNYIRKSSDVRTGAEFLENVLSQGKMQWWGWLYAFKRELWIKAGIVFDNGRAVCEDEAVLFRLFLQAQRVWVIDQYFYSYRIFRENSATGRATIKGIKDMLEVAEENIRHVEADISIPGSLRNKLVMNYASTFMTVGPALYQFRGIERELIYKQLSSKRWMIKKLWGYGGTKYRMKLVIVKIGGIRVGFSFINVCAKLRKSASWKSVAKGRY